MASVFQILTGVLLCGIVTASHMRIKLSDSSTNEIESLDIRLYRTKVPPDLTTYACASFPIPLFMRAKYYAVSFEPIIDNIDVMHHMIMFGCKRSTLVGSEEKEAHECGPTDNVCRSFVAQWSKGINGSLDAPDNAAVEFGINSYDTFALQIHWNNELNSSTFDSSGFRVYYTMEPREFSLGNVQVGQNDLEIPSNSSWYPQTGSCSAQCTNQWLTHPIYLTRAHIHMHYLGAGGVLELVRGSNVSSIIVQDDTYDYNKPPAHDFLNPVQVMPGDELRLTCFYNSRDGFRKRNRTVYWGEGSDGEMCYAFITYYPKIEHFDQCIQFAQYDVCSSTGAAVYGECVFHTFMQSFESTMAKDILKHCLGEQEMEISTNINPTNGDTRRRVQWSDKDPFCSDQCDIAVRELMEHPCMQGRLGRHAKRVYLLNSSQWDRVSMAINEWTSRCVF